MSGVSITDFRLLALTGCIVAVLSVLLFAVSPSVDGGRRDLVAQDTHVPGRDRIAELRGSVDVFSDGRVVVSLPAFGVEVNYTDIAIRYLKLLPRVDMVLVDGPCERPLQGEELNVERIIDSLNDVVVIVSYH